MSTQTTRFKARHLLCALLLATACKAPGTYVQLNFEAPQGAPAGFTKIVLNLTLADPDRGSLQDTVTIAAPKQFPSDAVLDIVDGEGELTIVGQLQNDTGTVLSQQTVKITVVLEDTVETTIVFPNGGPADMALGDQPPVADGGDLKGNPPPDLSTADLVVPPDLTTVDLSPVPVAVSLVKHEIDGATGVVTMAATACTPTCNGNPKVGDMVTLTVVPDSGFGWEGWPPGLGGTCTGITSPCDLQVLGPQTIDVNISPFNRIFMTKQMYTGDRHKVGDATTTLDFDAECARHAQSIGLPAADQYKAFYSTSSRKAADVLRTMPSGSVQSRGWVRLDKLPFGDTLTDLDVRRAFHPVFFAVDATNAMFDNVINLAPPDGKVTYWTGTTVSGTAGPNCTDFTQTTGANSIVGAPTAVGNGWADWGGVNSACDVAVGRGLLCMGTKYRAVVTVPKETGKLVFVSTGVPPVNGGLAAFDQTCWTDAAAANLCATADSSCKFKAAVADSAASPASRFTMDTVSKYVRPDGVLVANSQTDLFAVKLNTGIAVTASGAYAVSVSVVTGLKTNATSFNDSGDLGNTCNGWSAGSTQKLRTGTNIYSNVQAVNDGQPNCMTPPSNLRVYCIEN